MCLVQCFDPEPCCLRSVCAPVPGFGIDGCQLGCNTVSDCVFSNSLPVNDADNYECVDNVCRYTGCNSTQECKDSYPGVNYVCH